MENTFYTTKNYFADQGITQHRREMCSFVLCVDGVEVYSKV
jgi:hypothetical protein